jgi:hypothetical protein
VVPWGSLPSMGMDLNGVLPFDVSIRGHEPSGSVCLPACRQWPSFDVELLRRRVGERSLVGFCIFPSLHPFVSESFPSVA